MFNKTKKRIINTGQNLPQATYGKQFELWNKRDRLVKKPIMNQSRKDGTVLYGGHAVNALVDKNNQRYTYDFDVYSRQPKHHALQIEQSIDQGVNADLAYVEQTSYPHGRKQKPLFRVRTHMNDNVEADFNTMPQGIRFTKRKGVRYETLGRAEQKYDRMLRHPEFGRGFNANIDMGRIRSFKRRR